MMTNMMKLEAFLMILALVISIAMASPVQVRCLDIIMFVKFVTIRDKINTGLRLLHIYDFFSQIHNEHGYSACPI